MKRIIYLFMALFLFPAYSFAAVNSVTGTISNGETITISGSGFGANGPSVQIFDDFEKGTNNSELLTGYGSAQVGQWDGVDDSVDTPYFSNEHKISGSLAYKSENDHYRTEIVTAFPGNGVQKFYGSWWLYASSGANFSPNWKTVWVVGDGTSDDDCVFPTITGTSNASGLINGNETEWSKSAAIDFSVGEWKRIWVYAEGTTSANGVVKMWALKPTATQVANVSNAYIFAADGSPDTNYAFEQVMVNGYFGSGGSGDTYFDDVYIAYGDYCQARVEVGSHETYTDCTNLTVVTPTSWSDTSIEGKFWIGSFSGDDTAYVFVVDSDGDFIDQDGETAGVQGYEITIGSTGSSETPTTISVGGSGSISFGGAN